ncbi:hypothetical protein AAC387_Pa02g0234 [Persea americana]
MRAAAARSGEEREREARSSSRAAFGERDEPSSSEIRRGEREMRAATAAGQRLGREMRAAATRSGEERERDARNSSSSAAFGERDARSSSKIWRERCAQQLPGENERERRGETCAARESPARERRVQFVDGREAQQDQAKKESFAEREREKRETEERQGRRSLGLR